MWLNYINLSTENKTESNIDILFKTHMSTLAFKCDLLKYLYTLFCSNHVYKYVIFKMYFLKYYFM